MADILDEDFIEQTEKPTKNIGKLSIIYLVIMLLGGWVFHIWLGSDPILTEIGRLLFHLIVAMIISVISELIDWIKKKRKGEKYLNPIWFEWWENTFFMWWVIAIIFVMYYVKSPF